MEAHKNYVDFNELVSSITRIANNLDQMTEIMTTTSVKITPEKDVQDLKLENDRLKKCDELMRSFIYDATCANSCTDCRFNDDGSCSLNVRLSAQYRYSRVMIEMRKIVQKLEDL